MASDVALPRLDKFAEHLTRAWLYPDEEKVLDACTCPDLKASTTFTVCLSDDVTAPGKRKRKANLPDGERERREREAGELIRHWAKGMFNLDRFIVALASVRRRAHYAELGVKAPVLPGEVNDG